MTLQTSVIAHLIWNQRENTSKREGWTFTFLCTLYIKREYWMNPKKNWSMKYMAFCGTKNVDCVAYFKNAVVSLLPCCMPRSTYGTQVSYRFNHLAINSGLWTHPPSCRLNVLLNVWYSTWVCMHSVLLLKTNKCVVTSIHIILFFLKTLNGTCDYRRDTRCTLNVSCVNLVFSLFGLL